MFFEIDRNRVLSQRLTTLWVEFPAPRQIDRIVVACHSREGGNPVATVLGINSKRIEV